MSGHILALVNAANSIVQVYISVMCVADADMSHNHTQVRLAVFNLQICLIGNIFDYGQIDHGSICICTYCKKAI